MPQSRTMLPSINAAETTRLLPINPTEKSLYQTESCGNDSEKEEKRSKAFSKHWVFTRCITLSPVLITRFVVVTFALLMISGTIVWSQRQSFQQNLSFSFLNPKHSLTLPSPILVATENSETNAIQEYLKSIDSSSSRVQQQSAGVSIDDAILTRWDEWKIAYRNKLQSLLISHEEEQQQIFDFLPQLETKASHALTNAKNDTTLAWQNFQNMTTKVWNTTANETSHVWQAQTPSGTPNTTSTSRWWRLEAEKERHWLDRTETAIQNASQTTKRSMHRLSHQLQSLWNKSATETQHKNRILQHNFHKWWKHARHDEKRWWNDTVATYSHLSNRTRQSERQWWHYMQKETNKANNWTSREEEDWWNATRHWFHMRATYAEELQKLPIYMNTSRAYALLMNDYGWFDASADYFLMQAGLDVQMSQAYCGVVTVATILNSLRTIISVPHDPLYAPYPYATQLDLMNHSCVSKHVVLSNATINGLLVPPGGLTLDQVGEMLKCFMPPTFDIQVKHVDPLVVDIESMRKELQRALRDPRSRVLVNYHRRDVGQEGTGHFSPLGSYSISEDAFLILDVAKYKYPSSWVPTARLWQSMATVDDCGEWDFPYAQLKLNSTLQHPNNQSEYHESLEALQCKPAYRGYIIIESV